jgi:hypothetical protein
MANQGGHQVVREVLVKQYAHVSVALARELECSDGLFASDGRKLSEKFVQGIVALDVVEERPNGDPGVNKHGRSAQNLRVAVHDSRFVGHDWTLV